MMFSIIIPTFNRAHTVLRAVESVLGQTYTDLEVIVVDDGSTDDTQPRLAALEDGRLHYFYQSNQGRSVARNTGIVQARGEFVTFLDSDDAVRPTWLEQLAAAMRQPNVAIVCCGADVVDACSGAHLTTRLPQPGGPLYDQFRVLFLAGTYAVRRELFSAVGGFAPAAAPRENTELAIRLVAHCTAQGLTIASMDEPLLLYHKEQKRDVLSSEATRRLMAASEFTLARHPTPMQRDPTARARYHAVAGVCAGRLGLWAAARSHFRAALLAEPSPANIARYTLALMPLVGRQVWARHGRFTDSV
jgi:hypothetical protein